MTMEKPRKKKFYSSTSPDRAWDYVIIGSGIGGMTSGALLSKIGRRVLILEQHFEPGGFTQTFKRKGWVWDVGVHAVGEVTEKSVVGRLLTRLTDGRLTWASLGPVYDEFHYPDGFRIDFPDKPRKFVEALSAAFPGEKEAIGKYIGLVKQATGAMRGYYAARMMPNALARPADYVLAREAMKFLGMRTKDVLDRLTGNERLKKVLTSQWGYYGAPPDRSPFAIHAVVVNHFLYGAYYPVGGSKSIADALLRVVAEAGGWTRVRAPVAKILVRNGRAYGVRLENGEEILAGKVISAAGGIETARRLLPEAEQSAAWAGSVASLSASPAHLCLYLGFKGDPRRAGASTASKWFFETWDPEPDRVEIDLGRYRAPVLYVSFPSLKDPLHEAGPEMRHTGEVVTFIPYEPFRKWAGTKYLKRGPEYREMKKNLEERFYAQFLEHMPEIEPLVAYKELSTPLSTEYFTRAVGGGIYGAEASLERFRNPWLRPATPIGNLYMGGSDVSTCGVIGAMMGGVLAAAAAQTWDVLKFLRQK